MTFVPYPFPITLQLKVFIGGFGRVGDQVVPKNSTWGLKYSNARPHLGHIFLSLPAHY